MPDPTPAGALPTTIRHTREDVLVALDRVEHLLRFADGTPGQEALPVRIGPPLPAGTVDRPAADAWNLRVLVEELRAVHQEQAHPRETITLAVRPEIADHVVTTAAKFADLLATGKRGPIIPTMVSSTRLAEWLDEGSLDGELRISEQVPAGQTGRVFRLPVDHLRRIVGYLEAVKGGADA